MVTSLILFLALASLGVSFVLGIKWRRESNLLFKEITRSKQNISMGIMSVLVSIFFFLDLSDSTFKLIVALFMLAIGIFNVVQGMRMYRHYVKQLPN